MMNKTTTQIKNSIFEYKKKRNEYLHFRATTAINQICSCVGLNFPIIFETNKDCRKQTITIENEFCHIKVEQDGREDVKFQLSEKIDCERLFYICEVLEIEYSRLEKITTRNFDLILSRLDEI